MECPKCKNEVEEHELVCPHCKKVLKLKCPKCGTINRGNTCRRCGFVIISKCHQCGKINPTINGKCSKCGFSTYTSVAIASSDIDEFACLTIEFPNIDDIRSVMGSTKLTEKFKNNLDRLIAEYCGSIGTTREIIESVYVIRFNKEDSFKESCVRATNAALEILKQVGELNFKLEKAKNILLECKIAILKRDIHAEPDEYKSGFNIKLITSKKRKHKYLNCLQIITDQSINEQISDDYDLNTLSSCCIKNQMVMFFELNLKKHLNLEPPKEEKKEEAINLAKLNDIQEIVIDETEEREQKLYNTNSINFNELKCTFDDTTALELPKKIIESLAENKNRIITIRGKKAYRLSSNDLTEVLEARNIFQKCYRVTCNDDMKYKPYGFFYELLVCMNNFSTSPKTFSKNNFSMFQNVDESGFIKSLMNFEEREFPHPEDVRFSLFDIFITLFESMKNTLIYIENIDKIDDTSFEILQMIMEKFDKTDITYIMTADKDFLLHKKCHFLLNSTYYTELRLKPLALKELAANQPERYKELADSHYFIPIVQGARGSYLFFKNAIDYLTENNQVKLENGRIIVSGNKNVLIPQKLTDLMVKRFAKLAENVPAMELFKRVLLVGPTFDLNTIKYLGITNGPNGLKYLSDLGYLFVINGVLFIPEYELMRKALERFLTPEQLQEVAKDVLLKLYDSKLCHPVEARLLKMLGDEKREFQAWENLSKVNASMGDFSAYLNCSIKLLKLLDEKVIDENSEKTVDEYKLDVYENISNLLYKYTPNEVYNMSKVILKNLEESVNDKKVINMCNKMLQGCLISGNYSYALELVTKILSRFKNASLNPNSENFNVAYFLISTIKIEVLFSIGNMKDCVEAGEEILRVLDSDKLKTLKPEHLSEKQFEESILDSMAFVCIAKCILMEAESKVTDFIDAIKSKIGYVPEYYDYFVDFAKVVKGYKVSGSKDIQQDDKFSAIIYNIMKAFSYDVVDYEIFANDIYQAKISAKKNHLAQFELVCDLLIGYSYLRLEKFEKASSIFYNVLETSQNNGLKFVSYIAMYLSAELKASQANYDIALGISNNVVIQTEREDQTGDLLFFLFRVLMSRMFASKNDIESAEACFKNAQFIERKYGIEFDFTELGNFIEQKKNHTFDSNVTELPVDETSIMDNTKNMETEQE